MDTPEIALNTLTVRLKESIVKIAENGNFKKYNITVKMIPTLGGSYSGELFAVDIVGSTADGEKEINLFVKKLIPEAVANTKDMCHIPDLYAREAFVYTQLSKMFTELQDEANVPYEERFKLIKCYENTCSESLILENIAKKGFQTGFRMELNSFEFTKLALEQLAKFHGLSFVMEKRRPVFYREKVKTLNTVFFMPGWMNNLKGFMINNANKLKNASLRKKAEDFIPVALERYEQHFRDNGRHIQVLCHGDFRMNNTIKREIDGIVTEVIPVDYQTAFYSCPIDDIVYFIYSGSDKRLRDNHLSEFKDIYYNTMEKFLRYFNIDLMEVFPREVFDQTFEERREYGLYIAMMFMGVLLYENEKDFDFSKETTADWQPIVHESFQERLGDIIKEFL